MRSTGTGARRHPVELGLRAALVVLVVVLAAAITGGLLLRPVPAAGYAAVTGRTLLRQQGSGPLEERRTVRFGARRIGVAVRCAGRGGLDVELQPVGAVGVPCQPTDVGDGGFVLAGTSAVVTGWRVRTAPGNRWSLVLTQPGDARVDPGP